MENRLLALDVFVSFKKWERDVELPYTFQASDLKLAREPERHVITENSRLSLAEREGRES
jgi:hypothetical protein